MGERIRKKGGGAWEEIGYAFSHRYLRPAGRHPLFAPVSWHIKTGVVSPSVIRNDSESLQEHSGT